MGRKKKADTTVVVGDEAATKTATKVGKAYNGSSRDYARLLFIKESLTQKEVAKRLGVTEATISRWAKEEKWTEQKITLLSTKQEELRRLYQQLRALNDHIETKEEGKRFPDSREGDSLTKITAAIRSLETELNIAQVVDVFIDFLEWARGVDLNKAQEMVDLQDAYVKHIISKKAWL